LTTGIHAHYDLLDANEEVAMLTRAVAYLRVSTDKQADGA